MTVEIGRGVGRTGGVLAGVLTLLLAGSAGALPISLTGQDLRTDYTFVNSGQNNDSTLSFTKDGDASGLVSQVDNYTGPGLDGADLSAQKIRIMLNLSLGDDADNGSGPFVPTSGTNTGNVNRAQFVGGPGWEIAIYSVDDPLSDPNSPNAPPLLTFDVLHLDVTASTTAFGDTGSITLGDPTLDAVSSLLVISGGSLANDFGGIGTEARLGILLFDLSPTLVTRQGYLGNDFTNGLGGTATTWQITIEEALVPEPNTALLLGASLAAVGWSRRRRAR